MRSQVRTPLHMLQTAESGIGWVSDGKIVDWIGFGIGVSRLLVHDVPYFDYYFARCFSVAYGFPRFLCLTRRATHIIPCAVSLFRFSLHWVSMCLRAFSLTDSSTILTIRSGPIFRVLSDFLQGRMFWMFLVSGFYAVYKHEGKLLGPSAKLWTSPDL